MFFTKKIFKPPPPVRTLGSGLVDYTKYSALDKYISADGTMYRSKNFSSSTRQVYICEYCGSEYNEAPKGRCEGCGARKWNLKERN